MVQEMLEPRRVGVSLGRDCLLGRIRHAFREDVADDETVVDILRHPIERTRLASGCHRLGIGKETSMAEQDAAIIETHGEQDKIALAQLGAAVVLAWPLLDDDLQRDLIATATALDGVEKDPQFEAVINRLVQTNTRIGR